MESKKAYSIEQFCKAYGISRTSAYRAFRAGSGPKTIRIGRRVLIPHEQAEIWVQRLLSSGKPAKLAPIK